MTPRLATATVLGLVAAVAPLAPTDADAATTAGYRIPSLAAIFATPTSSTHGCTGAVVQAPGGAVVLTAAHCVRGRGTSLRVVPGYDRGARPYGTWAVTSVYVDPGWQASADPHRDLAVLRVAPLKINGVNRTLGSVVGGYRLGVAPAAGQAILGYGYIAGSGDRPVGCSAKTSYTAGYPTFPCTGMAGGVSGAPLMTLSADGSKTVRGVIGGLHEGGCSADISYSAPFGAWSTALVARGGRGGAGDYVRAPRGSGC